MRCRNLIAAVMVATLAISLEASMETFVVAQSPQPIYDTHLHYNQEAWPGLGPAAAQDLLIRAGVSRALVSSTPDDGTLKLHDFDPRIFVPELRPYHGAVNSTNWHDHPDVVAYLADRLKRGIYRGIGEVHFYEGRDVDTAVVRDVVAMAAARNIHLHVHAGAWAIKRLFEINPDVRILWAHAGMSEGAATVAAMLDRYPRLAAELSFRAEDITDENGDMVPAWRRLLIRHAERFTIGSDTYENARWAAYGELIAAHRHWLAQLPAGPAANIAFVNAARLFERK